MGTTEYLNQKPDEVVLYELTLRATGRLGKRTNAHSIIELDV